MSELAAAQADSGEIVVLMDPDPERSIDVVDDDNSQPSYKTEQLLSEASDVSLPSRKHHWMDTRLRTKLSVTTNIFSRKTVLLIGNISPIVDKSIIDEFS